MTIPVTCAAGSGTAMLHPNSGNQIPSQNSASEENKKEPFQKATQKSLNSGEAVYVAFG